MKLIFALSAGFFASLGSVFAKLSSSFESNESSFAYWNLFIYISFMTLMILCNSTGLFLFTKSLHEVNNTVVASLTSTACNYIISGILGMLLFQESLSLYWLIGTAMAIVGMLIIIKSEEEREHVEEKTD